MWVPGLDKDGSVYIETGSRPSVGWVWTTQGDGHWSVEETILHSVLLGPAGLLFNSVLSRTSLGSQADGQVCNGNPGD